MAGIKRKVGPLQMDPTRTTGLRARAMRDMHARLDALRRAVVQLVDTEDAFGLKDDRLPFVPLLNARAGTDGQSLTRNDRWRFETDAGKVVAFQGWLQNQVDTGLLATTGPKDKPWLSEYVDSAYKQAVQQAYTAKKPDLGNTTPDWYAGGQASFLKDAFGGPEALKKLELLYTRNYTKLKGFTDEMADKLTTVLANGMANGTHPNKLAKAMVKEIDGLEGKRALTIARTEILYAHAEGKLDTFEKLDPDMDLGVAAEWTTSGDPCPLCQPMAGAIFKIKDARGVIPRHPNCRCTWTPANVGEDPTGQKRGKEVRRAIAQSVQAERPKDPVEFAFDKTSWVGADTSTKKDAERVAVAAQQKAEAEAKAKAETEANLAAEAAAKKAALSAKIKAGMQAAKEKKAFEAAQAIKKQQLDKLLADLANHPEPMSDAQLASIQQAPNFDAKIQAALQVAVDLEKAAAKAPAEAAKKKAVSDKIKAGMAKAKEAKAAAQAQKEAEDAKAALAATITPSVDPLPLVAGPGAMPNPANLTKIKDLPGSTRPVLVADKLTGKQWVMKSGLDPDHVRSEALADELYRIAGADVPLSGIVETAEGPVKFAEFLDGGLVYKDLSDPAQKAAKEQLRKHFVTDAWLANWDVVGLSKDNILYHNKTAYRIDNGGALAYRAQGMKKANFGAVVDELDSLRNAGTNPQTASIFADITDAEINSQIASLVAKRDELLAAVPDAALRSTLAKRLDYLEARLPAQAAVTGPRRAEYGIGRKTPDRVKAARLNGTTIATDEGDIEDMNVLAFTEQDADGTNVTKLYMKVTPSGSKKIEATLGEQLRKATPATKSVAALDGYWEDVLKGAKTVNVHATDGNYNTGTLQQLDLMETILKLPHSEGTPEMKAYYLDAIKKIKEAKAAKTTTPAITQYVPPVPKAKAAVPVPEAGFRVRARALEFETKEIKNGRARVKAGNQLNRFSAGSKTQVYDIEAGEGVTVRFIPNAGSPFETEGLAFHGMLEIKVAEEASPAALQKAMGTLKSLGINTAAAEPAYEELVYLHRSVYLRNDHTNAAYANIWQANKPPEQKVKEIKAWVKTKYKIDVDKLPPEVYNPAGVTKTSFGDGMRHWMRWDLPPQEMNKEMRGYVLQHESSNLKGAIEGMLQSGGEATTTVGRVRKGVDVGTTGGMSSQADVRTGGASYFFTRIKSVGGPANEGIFFKISNLARQDAVSYSEDKFGRVSAFDERVSSIADYKRIAKNSSNETIFKEGLSLLDDVAYIRVGTATERNTVIKLFKDNKVEVLPDGRKVEDVIIKYGDPVP